MVPLTETVVCVGSVVRRDARVLLVRQAAGHSLAGQWTIPWGRLDQGESAAAAAAREVFEEGRIVAEVEGLLGIQELPAPWLGWLALVYLCRHVSGDATPDGRETDAARYYSAAELSSLAEPIEPWSAWLVRRVLSGKFTLTIASAQDNPFSRSPSFL
jgi:8-oxo-dGTP diphosphatase